MFADVVIHITTYLFSAVGHPPFPTRKAASMTLEIVHQTYLCYTTTFLGSESFGLRPFASKGLTETMDESQ